MKLTILGASGSVGLSTVDVVDQHRDLIQVEALVGGRNIAKLFELAKKLNARFVAIADETLNEEIKAIFSGSGIDCGAGASAVKDAVERECDTVLAAISGVAGLLPTYQSIKPGRRIALANKESLVCAGTAFMKEARRLSVEVLPVDSEHNALKQALSAGVRDDLVSAVLTASGGPFRTWSSDRIENASPKEASAHPTWSMGEKINVDSASLMNKGLELIEAHHLFDITPDKLDVLVHPQSIVHALAQWCDGAWTAELAVPDMRIPIANALSIGRRLSLNVKPLELSTIGSLSFEKVDEERFPCFSLARNALSEGGLIPTVLNAANEIAVHAFLQNKISFGKIAKVVEKTCSAFTKESHVVPQSVDEALAVDHHARSIAKEYVS